MSIKATGRVYDLAAARDTHGNHRATPAAPRMAYWWEAYMDDEVVRQLIREIEATKGRQTTHEEVSAERYRGIRQTLEELKAQIGHIASRITTDNGRWNKVIRGALVALVLALTSAVVWEAGQLYALEPLRIGATQHR